MYNLLYLLSAVTFFVTQPNDYQTDFAFDCVSGETCCWLKGAQPSSVPRANCTSGTTRTEVNMHLPYTGKFGRGKFW